MSDEDALLAAIAEHPAEDTPRLMYADWLEEHGWQVRAEFIRVQIEVSHIEQLPRIELNRYVRIFQRNQDLLDNHRAELLGPLAGLPADGVEVEFQRGFVSEVQLPVDDFLEHAAELAVARPQFDVEVTGVLARPASFLSNPHTGCVTKLSGYSEVIAASETRYDDFNLLDDIERMTRLAVLDLEGCGINDLHCDLAFNFSVPSLHDLDLSNNAITDAGVSDLLATDLPRQLKRLILGGNDITDVGAIALANRWPTGADDRLENLNLKFTAIGQVGQAALLRRFGGRVDLF